MRHPFDPAAPVMAQVRAIGLPEHLPLHYAIMYRFYDDLGRLLYVGITVSPRGRWQAHKKRASWWPAVRVVAIEHHPHEASALASEVEAIRSEAPMFNKRSARPKFMRPARDSQTLLTRSVPLSLSKSKSKSERGSYLLLTLVNADTREASHASDSLPSRPSHRVTGQADSMRWLG